MMSTARSLMGEHPTNPIKDTFMQSESNKPWTKSFCIISKIRVRTEFHAPGKVEAHFDESFLGEYEDEGLRLNEPAYPPNFRLWRLDAEVDGIHWFHMEISDVVLSAFARYPVLLQASHEKPLSHVPTDQTVDTSYSIQHQGTRSPVAIGEFKRGLIRPDQWQNGRLVSANQKSLSRELRGYAYKYKCPQVFCFDNYNLLLLQFRANTLDEIKDDKCETDCWILPRDNPQGTTLRYALYQLLVQGYRRCQGSWATGAVLYSQPPSLREFYNGRPLWKVDGKFYARPWGHCRLVDPVCGAFYWTGQDGSSPLLGQGGNRIWDTEATWEPWEESAMEVQGS